MAEFLSTLLTLSLQGGVLVLLVLGLRLVLKKAPKWTLAALWALVAARLLVPVSVQTTFSLMPDLSGVTAAVIQTAGSPVLSPVPPVAGTPAGAASAEPVFPTDAASVATEEAPATQPTGQSAGLPQASTGTVQPPASANPSPAADKTETSPETWLFALWCLGAAAVLGWGAIGYLRLRKKTRVSVYEDGAYLCDDIDEPFVLGILRPRVYLPSSLKGERRALVLAHEAAHIRRRDPAVKFLAFLLLAVYWFQPLTWLAFMLFSRDLEAACDERVVKDLSKEDRAFYAETLLSLSVRPKVLSVCPLAFGETNVKGRVKSILSYKKPAFWLILVAVLLAAGAAVFFLTQRAPSDAPTDADAGTTEANEPSSDTQNETGGKDTKINPGNSDRKIKQDYSQKRAKTEEERAAWSSFYYAGTPFVLPDTAGKVTLTRRDDRYILNDDGIEKAYSFLLCSPETVSEPTRAPSAVFAVMRGVSPEKAAVEFDYAEHWVLTNDKKLTWNELMLGPASSYYSPERENTVVVYEDFFTFDSRAENYGTVPWPFDAPWVRDVLSRVDGNVFYLQNGLLFEETWRSDEYEMKNGVLRPKETKAVLRYIDYRDGDYYYLPRGGRALAACETPEGCAALTANGDGVFVEWYAGSERKWTFKLPDSAGDAGINLAQTILYDDGRLYVFGMKRSEDNDENVSLIGIEAASGKDPEILFQKTYGGSDYDTFLSAEKTGTAPLTMTVTTQSRDGDFGLSPDGYAVCVKATLDKDGNVLSAEKTDFPPFSVTDSGNETDRLPKADGAVPNDLRLLADVSLPDGGSFKVRSHNLGWYPYMPPYLDRGMFFWEQIVTGYDDAGTAVWQFVSPVCVN